MKNMNRSNNIFLRHVLNGVLAIGLIVFMLFWGAAGFSDLIVLFVLVTGVLFLFFGIKSGGEDLRVTFIPLLFIFLVATAATAIFWVRAWQGMPGRMMADLFLNLFLFAFWWPGVLYVCVFRLPGEGWIPASRKRFFKLAGAGFTGGVAGILIAWGINENLQYQAAKKALFEELESIEQSLPANIELKYQLDGETLCLTYHWIDPFPKTSYGMLRDIRQLNARSTRLTGHRIPGQMVAEMYRGGRRFATLNWGPGSSGNPWDSLDLNYVAAELDSIPDRGDIKAILNETAGAEPGITDHFRFDMNEGQFGIFWAGNDSILETAQGVIELSGYLDMLNLLITELRLHFNGIQAYHIRLPVHAQTLDKRQTFRTMFRVQRFFTAEEHPLLLSIGDLGEDWTKPTEELPVPGAPVYMIEFQEAAGRLGYRPLWPLMAENVSGHTFWLVKTGPDGSIAFVVAPEKERGAARGPFMLMPGDSIIIFSMTIKNPGRGLQ